MDRQFISLRSCSNDQFFLSFLIKHPRCCNHGGLNFIRAGLLPCIVFRRSISFIELFFVMPDHLSVYPRQVVGAARSGARTRPLERHSHQYPVIWGCGPKGCIPIPNALWLYCGNRGNEQRSPSATTRKREDQATGEVTTVVAISSSGRTWSTRWITTPTTRFVDGLRFGSSPH